MTGQAVDLSFYLRKIIEIADIFDWVVRSGMPLAVLDRKNGDLILREVVFRQCYLALEDGDGVRVFQFLWLTVGTMALEAECAALRSQEFRVFAAMRLVASGASLRECRLMQGLSVMQFGNVGMAGETSFNWIGLQESRRFTSMRIVTRGAIALSAWMLHFCFFDLFNLVGMAGHTDRLGISLRQHHLAIFRSCVAAVAHFILEWVVHECLHQLRPR